MTTTEIINAVRRETGQKKTVVEDVFRSIIRNIASGVAIHGRVQIYALGTFKVREIAAQNRLNPKTGKVCHSRAKRRVVFKAVPELRNLPEGL